MRHKEPSDRTIAVTSYLLFIITCTILSIALLKSCKERIERATTAYNSAIEEVNYDCDR